MGRATHTARAVVQSWCFDADECGRRLSTFWTVVPMGQAIEVSFVGKRVTSCLSCPSPLGLGPRTVTAQRWTASSA